MEEEIEEGLEQRRRNGTKAEFIEARGRGIDGASRYGVRN